MKQTVALTAVQASAIEHAAQCIALDHRIDFCTASEVTDFQSGLVADLTRLARVSLELAQLKAQQQGSSTHCSDSTPMGSSVG